jgi:hypothetical protein
MVSKRVWVFYANTYKGVLQRVCCKGNVARVMLQGCKVARLEGCKVGRLECWNVGMLDCWIVGLLDCWIVGLLDC